MSSIRLGIIREQKIPHDKRTPFTPAQAAAIMKSYPEVRVVCQSGEDRCYSDDEYRSAGVPVVAVVSDCDILMGVKEVPPDFLLSNKTYFFFSHTIKKQAYNLPLLRTVLDRKIRLIDYETLTDRQGNRLVAFGRYAGIVGAYNGLWTYGKRFRLFDTRRALNCFDLSDLRTEFSKITLPPIKIVLTGSGRVGKGAAEVLLASGVQQTDVETFLTTSFPHPVFVQLNSSDYHKHKTDKSFDRQAFHEHPEHYRSDFLKFAHQADILIAGAYWNPAAPKLFTRDDMLDPRFRIKVIADISCDIGGAIPATVKASNVSQPVYDYDPETGQAKAPFSDERFVTVMAIDNLPSELPRDASHAFGEDLTKKILPHLFGSDPDAIIKRATIAEQGKLTENFSYLQSWLDE